MERRGRDRRLSKWMSDLERARIIGIRALQLSLGHPTYLTDISPGKMGSLDPLFVAREELERRVIPDVIYRECPDGSFELWAISELEIY